MTRQAKYGVSAADNNELRLTHGGWVVSERQGRKGWVPVPDTYRQSIDDAMQLRHSMQRAYDDARKGA